VSSESFFENLKLQIWDNRYLLAILVTIFLLGVAVRSDLIKYPGNYMFEPDASYHARMILNLVRDGSVPVIDNLNYYQVPGGVPNQAPSVYWYLSAFIFGIVNLLFNFGQPFNHELLLFSIQFMPAIFGACIAIAMYFLARDVFNNKKIGLITAFIAAITPAFVYRTMAGAQGDNSLGFLWMVIGFVFFVRAVKTKTLTKWDIINSLLAGILFLIMAMTWRMYILIPAILVPYAFFAIFHIASRAEHSHEHMHAGKNLFGLENLKTLLHNEVIQFAIKIFLSLGIFSILFLLGGYVFSQDPVFWLFSTAIYVSSITGINASLISLLVLVGGIISVALAYFISISKKETKELVELFVILGLIVGILVMCGLFLTQKDLFVQDRTSIGSMVGEESVGNTFFGTKYNSLIIFPALAIFLLPISLYFFKKKDSHTGILFFFWVIITLFMAWYKLKFTFVFGLAIAPAAAIVAYLLIESLSKLNFSEGLESKISYAALLFLCVLGVGAVGNFIPDYMPFPNSSPEQITLMNWIDANTAKDAKFFNWWNEGHVFSLETERKFSTDNRNSSPLANKLFAEFNITTDTNRGYEIASKEIGADYVYLTTDMLGVNSLATFEFYNAEKVIPTLAQKYYVGQLFSLTCYPQNTTTYSCNGNSVPKAQFDSISTTWKSVPDTFLDKVNPTFYYRVGDVILALNQAANNTNVAKVILGSPETSALYERVFVDGGIVVMKVKK
jgi:asparagine N-glycosylation enzyme membrane subunit Stt3